MVESAFDHERFLLVNGLLVGFSLSLLGKSVFLLLLILRLVFLEEVSQSLELILGKSVRELIDDSWDLKSLEEDSLLSLEENILWPSDVSGQVSLRLDVSTDLVVSRSGLDEFGVSSLLDINLINFGHRL
jgi:hypothetical protein